MSTTQRVLAIETSSSRGSIALLESDQIVAERALPTALRTAQSLIPSIGELTRSLGWRIGEIPLIAVSQGPGSFTGLRVGVATANSLAYATKAKIVGVNTLDCIAGQAATDRIRLEVAIDAQRGDLCAARYQRQPEGELTCDASWEIVGRREWIGRLSTGDAVTGPALAKLRDELTGRCTVVAEQFWSPTAGMVGRLAWAAYNRGHCDDPWMLRPIYFRQSAAEEKLAKE